MNFPFPQKLPLAQLPTPIQPLDRISERLNGPRIWVKRDDLTEFGAGGNKIRKLEYLLADAKAQGADVVITCGGIQSNHCRATALLAARCGLKCHLILRGEAPPELEANTLLDALAGASLSFYTQSEFKRLNQLFADWHGHFSRQGLKVYEFPTGGSNEVGLWGYIEAAQELQADIRTHNLSVNHIVCATGSGGTHTGLALGLQQQFDLTGFAVCDSRSYFEAKGRADIAAWRNRYSIGCELRSPNLEINDEYIGPGYALAYPELLATIRLLAQTEGLLLDPVYTGKAFHGLVEKIKSGQINESGDVVFVHTGGVFGLFPFGRELQKPPLELE